MVSFVESSNCFIAFTGFASCLPIDFVLDESNGLFKDDRIIFEIYVGADPPANLG